MTQRRCSCKFAPAGHGPRQCREVLEQVAFAGLMLRRSRVNPPAAGRDESVSYWTRKLDDRLTHYDEVMQ